MRKKHAKYQLGQLCNDSEGNEKLWDKIDMQSQDCFKSYTCSALSFLAIQRLQPLL